MAKKSNGQDPQPPAVIQEAIAMKQSESLLAVAQQREVAEVQSKMIIAQRFPRKIDEAIKRIMAVCQRPSLAEKATYSYARGGTKIEGASIRLAEAIAQNWGNIEYGVRELENVDGESTVEAYAWDLETNVSQRKTFKVAHIRTSKERGNVLLTDPRDVYEMIANQAARRMRSCILGIIPTDVVEDAMDQCQATLAQHVAITPERIKGMLQKFSEIGVTREQIETVIQCRLEKISPQNVVHLGKIYNSIVDGMSSVDSWFKTSAPKQHGVVNMDDIKPAQEPNRGHGNEAFGKPSQTPKPPKPPKQTEPAPDPMNAPQPSASLFDNAPHPMPVDREPGEDDY